MGRYMMIIPVGEDVIHIDTTVRKEKLIQIAEILVSECVSKKIAIVNIDSKNFKDVYLVVGESLRDYNMENFKNKARVETAIEINEKIPQVINSICKNEIEKLSNQFNRIRDIIDNENNAIDIFMQLHNIAEDINELNSAIYEKIGTQVSYIPIDESHGIEVKTKNGAFLLYRE